MKMVISKIIPSTTTFCLLFGLSCYYLPMFCLCFQLFGFYEFSIFVLDYSHLAEPSCNGCGLQHKTSSLINTHRDFMMNTTMWLNLFVLGGSTFSGLALYEGVRMGRSWMVLIFMVWCPLALLAILATQVLNQLIKTDTTSDLVIAAMLVLWGSLGAIQAYKIYFTRFFLSPAMARVLGVMKGERKTVLEAVAIFENLSTEEKQVVKEVLVVENITESGIGRFLEQVMDDESSNTHPMT